MTDDPLTCPACLRDADRMGVLDSGERVYLHGSSYCLADLDDRTGLLGPAVDQISAYFDEVT